MKCSFISMYPKDDYDEIITVQMTPRWYESIDLFDKPKEECMIRFWGSGHQWWEEKTDKRADGWLSDILYEYWREETNRRIERKNCRE